MAFREFLLSWATCRFLRPWLKEADGMASEVSCTRFVGYRRTEEMHGKGRSLRWKCEKEKKERQGCEQLGSTFECAAGQKVVKCV